MRSFQFFIDVTVRSGKPYTPRQMHINWAVNLLSATLSTVTQSFISQFLITFSFKYMNQKLRTKTERELKTLLLRKYVMANVWKIHAYFILLNLVKTKMKWKSLLFWGYAWLLSAYVMCDLHHTLMRPPFNRLIGCFFAYTFYLNQRNFASNQGKH